MNKKPILWNILILSIAFLLSACGAFAGDNGTETVVSENGTVLEGSKTSTISPTPSLAPSFTPSMTPSLTPSLTPSPTPSLTSTSTLTSTPTRTPTITPSPTLAVPSLTVSVQSHCRYGPGKAYLHAADLYPGDFAVIDGKSGSGSWLWIQPQGLDYHCWVAKSVVEVQGDLAEVPYVPTRLPMSVANLYLPPEKVWADRDGDSVTIYWSDVWMTVDDDRGYLLEVSVCQNGSRLYLALWTDKAHYELQDDRKGCAGQSGGKLYAVEKHGYLQPLDIPWP